MGQKNWDNKIGTTKLGQTNLEKRGWGQKDLVTFLLHTHTHTSPLYIDQQQHQHRRRHFVICLHCTRIVIGPRHTLDLMNCVPMHQQRNCQWLIQKNTSLMKL